MRLYTYLPKDNTAASDGLLSTGATEHGFEEYRGRTRKYRREDVLRVLDSWEPGWRRSKALSALAEPIPDNARKDLRDFAGGHHLYSFDTKDLIRKDILVHLRETNKSKGTHEVSADALAKAIDWQRRKPGCKLLFSGIPHYMVETKDGKIPAELVRDEEKQAYDYTIRKTPGKSLTPEQVKRLTALLDRIVRENRRKRLKTVLSVHLNNKAGLSLYGSRGFKPINQIMVLDDSEKKAEKLAAEKIDISKLYEEIRKRYSDMGFAVEGDKLVVSEQPTYMNGNLVPRSVMKPNESGGNVQSDGTIRINPKYRSVMKQWGLKGSGSDFVRKIIGHEMGHHIDFTILSKPEHAAERKKILDEIARRRFHTVYTDSYGPDTDRRKLDKELLAEYLAHRVTQKKISFPEEEIPKLMKQDRIFTTRVSDDFDRFSEGDVVVSPWGDEFVVQSRKVIPTLNDHPFYDQLTDKQKADIGKHKRIAGLWLDKKDKK